MNKLYLLPLFLLFAVGVCLGAERNLQTIADNYNRLVEQPLVVSLKPELYSVQYDFRKNIVEVKLTESFYRSRGNGFLPRKIEKYEPTLLFEPGLCRLAMSYRI